ncbi:MAG: GNAT family N-acetyltransferase [Armatimonadetes bacterium]|nr:GNAT family N-acetyltransferase [Armatimonadota bacterium]
MLTIRQIQHGTAEYEETVALRDDILRRPLGLTFTPESLAGEASEIHIACYSSNQLVGCLILAPLGNGELKMRQVAVADLAQGQGIGKAMVEFSENFARNNGFSSISMHARETAVPFYLKLGYEVIGERFEEVSIPHFKMTKGM